MKRWIRTLDRHMGLMRGMARKTGADLTPLGETEAGELALRNALIRCTTCANPDACADWQDRTMDGAGTPPPFCRNARLMERLAGGDA